jgi:hypothetical protein
MNKQTPKVGFVFSTKERVDLSRRSLRSVDSDSGFDLIWLDGSTSEEARRLPESIKLRKTRLVEVHLDVKGGPDAAIRYGLRRLLALGYDYCGLIENDIEFVPGWFSRLMELFRLGEIDDLQVGAATTRTVLSRTLAPQSQYATLWNIGAGMVLFTRKAARIVLRHYHPRRAKEVSAYFKRKYGNDLRHIWELWMDRNDRLLGCDWGYSLELDKRGLSSLGTVPTYSYNVDLDPKTFSRSDYLGGIAKPGLGVDFRHGQSDEAAQLTPPPMQRSLQHQPARLENNGVDCPSQKRSVTGISFPEWLYWKLGLPLPIRFVRRIQRCLGK